MSSDPLNLNLPKEILAKRFGELRSRWMKTAVKSPESTDCRCELGIFLTETPSTEAPKHFFRPLFPRNPHFPALRSSHELSQRPSPQKQIPSINFKITSFSLDSGVRRLEWTGTFRNEHSLLFKVLRSNNLIQWEPCAENLKRSLKGQNSFGDPAGVTAGAIFYRVGM